MPTLSPLFHKYLYQHANIIRFLLVGGMNTLFGYVCYAAALGLAHMQVPAALLTSQIAGIMFNYISYGRLAFHVSHTKKKSLTFLRFLVAYTVTYFLNLEVLNVQVSYGVSKYLAQIICLIIIVPATYVLLRFGVWRTTKSSLSASENP